MSQLIAPFFTGHPGQFGIRVRDDPEPPRHDRVKNTRTRSLVRNTARCLVVKSLVSLRFVKWVHADGLKRRNEAVEMGLIY